MHDPFAHEIHALHQREQVAPYARRHQRGKHARVVDRHVRRGFAQAYPGNPFHDHGSVAIDGALPVKLRKSFGALDDLMAAVFLFEGPFVGRSCGGAIVFLAGMQNLQRELLAEGVFDSIDRANAAFAHRAFVDEQGAESAAIRRALVVFQRRIGDEIAQHDHAQSRLLDFSALVSCGKAAGAIAAFFRAFVDAVVVVRHAGHPWG